MCPSVHLLKQRQAGLLSLSLSPADETQEIDEKAILRIAFQEPFQDAAVFKSAKSVKRSALLGRRL